jgi:putative nucleotidyltransferase with HDIG domain
MWSRRVHLDILPNKPDEKAILENILAKVEDLKPLPATVTRALRLMEQPDVALTELADALATDQALTARILRLGNSAFYGCQKPAATLTQAIMRIGLETLRSILFTVSFSGLLGRRLAAYNAGSGVLWQHSLAVALCSRHLSQRAWPQRAEEIYVAGLLHDMGKLVLDQYLKADYARLQALIDVDGRPVMLAEREVFGVDHATVGAEMARRWRLPASLVDAIEWHHAGVPRVHLPEMPVLVHVADSLCMRLGLGISKPVQATEVTREAIAYLGLTDQDLPAVENVLRRDLELFGSTFAGASLAS